MTAELLEACPSKPDAALTADIEADGGVTTEEVPALPLNMLRILACKAESETCPGFISGVCGTAALGGIPASLARVSRIDCKKATTRSISSMVNCLPSASRFNN